MKNIKIKPELVNKIKDVLKESPIKEEVIHAELVLNWLLQLKSDADEALQIAALSHDIDRGVTKITESHLKDYSEGYVEYKKQHALRSAKFIAEILKEYKYPTEVIEKVTRLVEKHEVGGDEESDILRDADSLAYFEYNIPFYLHRNGEERTKRKIQFMYNRMSDKAKKIANAIKYQDEKIMELVRNTISNL